MTSILSHTMINSQEKSSSHPAPSSKAHLHRFICQYHCYCQPWLTAWTAWTWTSRLLMQKSLVSLSVQSTCQPLHRFIQNLWCGQSTLSALHLLDALQLEHLQHVSALICHYMHNITIDMPYICNILGCNGSGKPLIEIQACFFARLMFTPSVIFSHYFMNKAFNWKFSTSPHGTIRSYYHR